MKITNRNRATLEVAFEPWGMLFILQDHETLTFEPDAGFDMKVEPCRIMLMAEDTECEVHITTPLGECSLGPDSSDD